MALVNSDLQVMLANEDRQDWSSSSKPDFNSHGQHVWVPFVEAIAPEVRHGSGRNHHTTRRAFGAEFTFR